MGHILFVHLNNSRVLVDTELFCCVKSLCQYVHCNLAAFLFFLIWFYQRGSPGTWSAPRTGSKSCNFQLLYMTACLFWAGWTHRFSACCGIKFRCFLLFLWQNELVPVIRVTTDCALLNLTAWQVPFWLMPLAWCFTGICRLELQWYA